MADRRFISKRRVCRYPSSGLFPFSASSKNPVASCTLPFDMKMSVVALRSISGCLPPSRELNIVAKPMAASGFTGTIFLRISKKLGLKPVF